MRKTIIGITTAFLLVAAAPAGAAVLADSVVHEIDTGGCSVQYSGTHAIVLVAVVDPAAITLSVTCHVTQHTGWGTRYARVDAAGVGGVAAGAAVLTDWDFAAPYDICVEMHATYLTRPAFSLECH